MEVDNGMTLTDHHTQEIHKFTVELAEVVGAEKCQIMYVRN